MTNLRSVLNTSLSLLLSNCLNLAKQDLRGQKLSLKSIYLVKAFATPILRNSIRGRTLDKYIVKSYVLEGSYHLQTL